MEKECAFRWDMERMKDRNYVYFFWNGENEKARDEFFGALERKYGIRQGPPTARILYQEYADRYVFVAEDGVYATDTIECERIVLISRDCWKAQEILLTKGLIGAEGPWRAEGQKYDAEAENQEADWYRNLPGYESPVSYHSSDDDPSYW